MPHPSSRRPSDAAKLVVLGAVVALLYGVLFTFEGEIVSLTRAGGWSFVVPIAIALVFSLAHGSFTGRVWDFIGVKPRKASS